MRIVMFTHEFPYPANNGGRIDIWNRLKALHILGHEVFLIAWSIYEDNQKEESIAAVNEIVNKLIVFKRKNNLLSRFWNLTKKLALLPFQPNIVTECQLTTNKKNELLNIISGFKPDVFLSDAVFAAETTLYFAKKLAVPFFIRSHNVEHVYVKKQLQNATNLKSVFKIGGTYFSLKKYEKKMFVQADGILDISMDDVLFWQSEGIKNIRWSPPVFFDNPNRLPLSQQHKLYELCYVGNLYNPNNIKGLSWFINDVLPLIKQQLPSVRMCIAGSKPTPEVVSMCEANNITLMANPVSVNEIYSQSKVLINPTLFGSGVNLKTVEQLFEDVPVVCTSAAIKGLPPEFKLVFNIADSKNDFSAKALNLLIHKQEVSDHQTNNLNFKLRSFFSPEYYDAVLNELLKVYIEPTLEKIA